MEIIISGIITIICTLSLWLFLFYEKKKRHKEYVIEFELLKSELSELKKEKKIREKESEDIKLLLDKLKTDMSSFISFIEKNINENNQLINKLKEKSIILEEKLNKTTNELQEIARFHTNILFDFLKENFSLLEQEYNKANEEKVKLLSWQFLRSQREKEIQLNNQQDKINALESFMKEIKNKLDQFNQLKQLTN